MAPQEYAKQHKGAVRHPENRPRDDEEKEQELYFAEEGAEQHVEHVAPLRVDACLEHIRDIRKQFVAP